MNRHQIIELQKHIGVEPDGFWGPISTEACKQHLRNLMSQGTWSPKTDQASLTKAYGAPGDASQLTQIDVSGLGVRYDGQKVKEITCNKAVAVSLLSVLEELATFPEGQAFLADHNGCYNNRLMRGGSLPSLHARGAAIDGQASTNGNKEHWPTSADMPIRVMETFARHGWLSAGAFWSRDAMHFQKTQ